MQYFICDKCGEQYTVGYLTPEYPEWTQECRCGNQLAMALVRNPDTNETKLHTFGGRYGVASTGISAPERTRLDDGSLIEWSE
jgi:hypothetical protein